MTEPSVEALTFARKLAFATIKEIAYALDAFAAQARMPAEAELAEWKGDKLSFCRNNSSYRCATILACHDQCARFASLKEDKKSITRDLQELAQKLCDTYLPDAIGHWQDLADAIVAEFVTIRAEAVSDQAKNLAWTHGMLKETQARLEAAVQSTESIQRAERERCAQIAERQASESEGQRLVTVDDEGRECWLWAQQTAEDIAKAIRVNR